MPMTRRRRTLAWAGAVLGLCVIVEGPWLVRQFRIDGCLDRGGRWDYERDACEESPDRAAIGACVEGGGGEWDYGAGRCVEGVSP